MAQGAPQGLPPCGKDPEDLWGPCLCIEVYRQWEFASLRVRFQQISAALGAAVQKQHRLLLQHKTQPDAAAEFIAKEASDPTTQEKTEGESGCKGHAGSTSSGEENSETEGQEEEARFIAQPREGFVRWIMERRGTPHAVAKVLLREVQQSVGQHGVAAGAPSDATNKSAADSESAGSIEHALLRRWQELLSVAEQQPRELLEGPLLCKTLMGEWLDELPPLLLEEGLLQDVLVQLEKKQPPQRLHAKRRLREAAVISVEGAEAMASRLAELLIQVNVCWPLPEGGQEACSAHPSTSGDAGSIFAENPHLGDLHSSVRLAELQRQPGAASGKLAEEADGAASARVEEREAAEFERLHGPWLLRLCRPLTWILWGPMILRASAALAAEAAAAAARIASFTAEHAGAAVSLRAYSVEASAAAGEGGGKRRSCVEDYWRGRCCTAAAAAAEAQLPATLGCSSGFRGNRLSSEEVRLVGPPQWSVAWRIGRRFHCLALQGDARVLLQRHSEGQQQQLEGAVGLLQTRFFIRGNRLLLLWRRFLSEWRRRGSRSCCCCCAGGSPPGSGMHCSSCAIGLQSAQSDEAVPPDWFSVACRCSKKSSSEVGACKCVGSELRRLHALPACCEQEPQRDVCGCLVDAFIHRVFVLLCRTYCICGQNKEGRGLGCGVPLSVLQQLQQHLGEPIEAFASPLNARCRLYFSLFEDTDAPFGSRGCFFASLWKRELDPRQHPLRSFIFCNPPFEEVLIQRLEAHILSVLSESNGSTNNSDPLVFVLCLPDWKSTVQQQQQRGAARLAGSRRCLGCPH
ncbi:hypothetical protein cyc_02267 [Cyclospora cayetanensis]|uniref:PCIF1 WW domain-containing protein n=1 Tax=Cyclospora cayetanensis TaxID=88456 RepID=A0A1D3D3J4_9EIME|nr:hypothetical protein cyc_02267 [Cyclospora cayetanensis]